MNWMPGNFEQQQGRVLRGNKRRTVNGRYTKHPENWGNDIPRKDLVTMSGVGARHFNPAMPSHRRMKKALAKLVQYYADWDKFHDLSKITVKPAGRFERKYFSDIMRQEMQDIDNRMLLEAIG